MCSEPFLRLHFQIRFSLLIGSISKLFKNSFCFLKWKLHYLLTPLLQMSVMFALARAWHAFSSAREKTVLISTQLSWTFSRQKWSWRQFWHCISSQFLHCIWEHLLFTMFVIWNFTQLCLWLVCSGSGFFFLLMMLGFLEACKGFSLIQLYRTVWDFFFKQLLFPSTQTGDCNCTPNQVQCFPRSIFQICQLSSCLLFIFLWDYRSLTNIYQRSAPSLCLHSE